MSIESMCSIAIFIIHKFLFIALRCPFLSFSKAEIVAVVAFENSEKSIVKTRATRLTHRLPLAVN